MMPLAASQALLKKHPGGWERRTPLCLQALMRPPSCAAGPGRLSVLLIHITAGNGQMNHHQPLKIPQPHLTQ